MQQWLNTFPDMTLRENTAHRYRLACCWPSAAAERLAYLTKRCRPTALISHPDYCSDAAIIGYGKEVPGNWLGPATVLHRIEIRLIKRNMLELTVQEP